MSINKSKSRLGKQTASFIARTRLKRGYTQEYMALQLDIHQATYSRLEMGSYDFSLDALEKIAAIFEMSIPEFFLSALLEDGHFPAALVDHLSDRFNREQSNAFNRIKRELSFSGSRFVVLSLLMESINKG